MAKKIKYLLFVALFLTVVLPLDAQCAMCRAVLQSDADQGMAEGVNNGIIYLMAIPYILVGGLVWYIYKTRNKQDI